MTSEKSFQQADYGETIFVVGNSLTRHRPRPEIGWEYCHGMAATAPERDYVHLLLNNINTATGKKYDLVIAQMENEQNMVGLKPERPAAADIVILQVGDNYLNKLTPDELSIRYTAILRELKTSYPDAILVAVSTWMPYPPGEQMHQCAKQEGVLWADISKLGPDVQMRADSEGHFSDKDVNWHPGDKGMKAIAETIWTILAPTLHTRSIGE